jgi:hypothetical protein
MGSSLGLLNSWRCGRILDKEPAQEEFLMAEKE